MSALGQALRTAVGVLDRARVPYMLVGGLATVIWGEARATQDVDLTIDVGARPPEEVLDVARRIGEPVAEDPVAVAVEGRLVPVRTPAGIRIDLILATLAFELQAIARAVQVDVEGTPVRVCRPEDLVVQKIVSERPRDQEDIVGVLRRRATTLDVDQLDTWIAELSRDLDDPSLADRWIQAKRLAAL